jgi:hypothetical protein
MKKLIGLAIAFSVFAGDKAEPLDPAYDVATVVDFTAAVMEVREVPKDQAMAGLHVMVKSETKTLDIHVGPSEFVKVFDVAFAKGDEIRVVGSKVEFEGSTVVLAREVTIGSVTLLCRDKDGSPLWKYFIKPPVG